MNPKWYYNLLNLPYISENEQAVKFSSINHKNFSLRDAIAFCVFD